MKVNSKISDGESIRRQVVDTENLLQNLIERKERPCPGCTLPCPCSQSTSCSCGCSPECEYCPSRMSSEPDRYPIEKKIVPLVYAFFDSHVYEPCWSCEGHLNNSGDHIHKLPRIWFYTSSIVYTRLLAAYLEDLHFKKQLTHAWGIRILGWSDTSEARFSLEPILGERDSAHLLDLQNDAAVIAKSLKKSVYELGLDYQLRLQSL